MTLFSAYSPVNGGAARPDGRRRRLAAVASCAGAFALIAGCSAGPGGGNGTTGSPRLTPQKAISLAADQTQRVSSMAATFTERIGQPVVGTTSGTMRMRLKPSLLAHETLTTKASGQNVTVEEITTAKAIYVKEPAGQAGAGKAWIGIRFSELTGSLGSSLSSLVQNAQADNPATQTQMLAASKNVHVVGTEVVDGVQTTHYAGTFTLSAALATLSPTLRKGLAPLTKMINGEVTFNAWIDSQHVARRVTEAETVSGEPVFVTLNVTAINQPVQISPPPASQVRFLPKSELGGL